MRYSKYVNEKAQTYQRFQYIKTNMKIISPHVAVMSNFRRQFFRQCLLKM